MEFKQLAVFQIAAEELNFTRTAERLNYAQSSVTAHIQSLEKELGIKLFERIGKRVLLTEAGERLQGHAGKILQMVQEAVVHAQGSLEPAGTLTIGAPDSLSTYRLSSVLLEFRSAYPQVAIIFRTGISADLRRELSRGGLDLVFTIEEPVYPNELMVEVLREEPLVMVSSPRHRLSHVQHVEPKDLDGESILVTERGCSYRLMLEQVLSAHKVIPSARLEFASVEAIKQCVIAGLGVALLPQVAIQKEIETRQLVALDWGGSSFATVLQLFWHKDKWISPAMRAFLAMATSMLRRDAT